MTWPQRLGVPREVQRIALPLAVLGMATHDGEPDNRKGTTLRTAPKRPAVAGARRAARRAGSSRSRASRREGSRPAKDPLTLAIGWVAVCGIVLAAAWLLFGTPPQQDAEASDPPWAHAADD